jgi:hypothetical protein
MHWNEPKLQRCFTELYLNFALPPALHGRGERTEGALVAAGQEEERGPRVLGEPRSGRKNRLKKRGGEQVEWRCSRFVSALSAGEDG